MIWIDRWVTGLKGITGSVRLCKSAGSAPKPGLGRGGQRGPQPEAKPGPSLPRDGAHRPALPKPPSSPRLSPDLPTPGKSEPIPRGGCAPNPGLLLLGTAPPSRAPPAAEAATGSARLEGGSRPTRDHTAGSKTCACAERGSLTTPGVRYSVRRRVQAGSARSGGCGDLRLFGRATAAYGSVVGAAPPLSGWSPRGRIKGRAGGSRVVLQPQVFE